MVGAGQWGHGGRTYLLGAVLTRTDVYRCFCDIARSWLILFLSLFLVPTVWRRPCLLPPHHLLLATQRHSRRRSSWSCTEYFCYNFLSLFLPYILVLDRMSPVNQHSLPFSSPLHWLLFHFTIFFSILFYSLLFCSQIEVPAESLESQTEMLDFFCMKDVKCLSRGWSLISMRLVLDDLLLNTALKAMLSV